MCTARQVRADAQVEVITKVEVFKLPRPQLGRPHADTFGGSKHAKMKELRADTGDQLLRIAFSFDPDRSAILLLGGNKSGVNFSAAGRSSEETQRRASGGA
jgi:hypothetical protein